MRSITNNTSPTVDSRKQCPICIDEYEIGDEICSSPNKDCPHVFHVECMTEWLMKHSDCPLCRADYLKINEGDIVDLESGRFPVAFPAETIGL